MYKVAMDYPFSITKDVVTIMQFCLRQEIYIYYIHLITMYYVLCIMYISYCK